MKITSVIPNHISKDKWKEEHLNRKHKEYYSWCKLCVAKFEGEENNTKPNDLGVNVSEKVKPKSVFGK